MKINKSAYEKLLQDDIAAINKHIPDGVIKDHIKLIVCDSIDLYYPDAKDKPEPKGCKYRACQTFLKAAIEELLKAEKSIVKDGWVKISLDEKYKCSNVDLAKYNIECEYPLHLIHFGIDLHKAELKLNDQLKQKWNIT